MALKKFGEIILAILAVLGLPSIIQIASTKIYNENTNLIWGVTAVLAVLIIFTQLDLRYNPKINRTIRTVRFHVFKTKTIALFLTLQILTSLIILLIKDNNFDSRLMLISFGINLLALNLLVLSEKIINTDSKELIFHRQDGRMYLYSKNQLKYIPDPPTFNLLGLSWAEAIDLNEKDFSSYKTSSPITSIKDMQLLKYRGGVYGLVNDKLKHIPDPPTLQFILQHRANQEIREVITIDDYILDKPFASIHY
jgi:hypothetical protein